MESDLDGMHPAERLLFMLSKHDDFKDQSSWIERIFNVSACGHRMLFAPKCHIAKPGLLLSRGRRADLATTRPKRFELWPGSRALLSFKTVYNTFENRRMHQCWWGGCGHVMALHSMPAEWANGFGSGCARSWRQSH